jgi:hypothetical protein|tara:strand:+ start:2188 stop:2544 length:357 start_codon:yes stop_codon:yes gene_type:complete
MSSPPKRIKPRHIAEQFSLPLGETYPCTPGYKNRDKTGPSRKAALSIKPHALNLRGTCFRAISQIPMTADEVARAIGKSILSVRPRVAELSKLGKIEDSGKRRPNDSGKDATVWRIKL